MPPAQNKCAEYPYPECPSVTQETGHEKYGYTRTCSASHGILQPHAVTHASPPPFLQHVDLHSLSHWLSVSSSSQGILHPHAVTHASPPPFLQHVDLHSLSHWLSVSSSSHGIWHPH